MRFFLGRVLGPIVLVSALVLLWTWIFPVHADGKVLEYVRASRSTVIDLAKAVPVDWDRACVLGPYSGDAAAETALGFKWDVDAHSGIRSSDAISLIVFVKGQKVIRDIDVPQSDGDFSNLSGHCFPREQARFAMKRDASSGWSHLAPADAS